jgi:hypothetical protein
MLEKYGKPLRALVAGALIVESAACGTILYPERRGQRGGRVDAGVAVLDAVGLLFFIIPGVIAFAVDFGNGAIYLPSGGKGILGRGDPVKVRFDPKGDAKASVERIVRERTGRTIRLDRDEVEVIELKSVDELPARFAAASV